MIQTPQIEQEGTVVLQEARHFSIMVFMVESFY